MKSLQEQINDALKTTEAEVERAKIEFTEQLLATMEARGISRSELARLLGVKPARITALLRGSNNFTLETLVRTCRAIGATYRHYIQAPGVVSVSFLMAPVGVTLADTTLWATSVSDHASGFVLAMTPQINLWPACSLPEFGSVVANPLLLGTSLTLPTGGNANPIELGKAIDFPKKDADLALAA